MKAIFGKQLAFAAAIATFCVSTAFASTHHYSNVIVFGDSLSDIGNLPESHEVISPELNAVSQNVYVPISNPVDTSLSPYYTPPMSSEQLPFPRLVMDYQSYQPELHLKQGDNVKMRRDLHSFNWPLFFVSEAYQHQLIDTPTITPWYLTQKLVPNVEEHGQISVDYAFAGAVSEDRCYNFEYQRPNSLCGAFDIYHRQQAYRMGDPDMAKVEVPGFRKQVSLFIGDKLTQRVVTDRNSLFVVLTGDNDLNKAMLAVAKLKTNPIAALAALKHVYMGGVAKDVSAGLQQLINSGARHIVVMGMYDPGKTPYIATNLWGDNSSVSKNTRQAIQDAVSATAVDYNVQLQMMVAKIKLAHPLLDIRYFDLFKRLNTLHDQVDFSQSDVKYKMCIAQLSTSKVSSFVQGQPLTCAKASTYGLDNDYMFWNGTHMTAKSNEYIADQLYKSLT